MALEKVSWVNVWDYSRTVNGDGGGSRTHLTNDRKKTLCGQRIPPAGEAGFEGLGSSPNPHFCRRCQKSAQSGRFLLERQQ